MSDVFSNLSPYSISVSSLASFISRFNTPHTRPVSLPPGWSLYSTSSPACCLGHPAGLLPCCPGNRPQLRSPPLPSPSLQSPPPTTSIHLLLFFLRTNGNPVARWNAHLNQPIQEPNCLPCLIRGCEEGHSPHSCPTGDEPLYCPFSPA